MNKIPLQIQHLMQQLIHKGYDAYIIGGAVRDILLGFDPHDYDIFTNATGEQIRELFPQGKVIGSEERQSRILTVIVDGVEVSQYRKDGKRQEVGGTLAEHLATCDFTINAIAMDIHGVITDPYNGRTSLTQLKAVGCIKDRLDEDPLRLLRAVRFISKLDLDPDKELEQQLYLSSKWLSCLPKERIREEFIKILQYKNSITTMYKYSILQTIIPIFTELLIEGGYHHNEFVNVHCMLAYTNARNITNDYRVWLAALLHDVGKAKAYTKDEHGKVTFKMHEVYSYDYACIWLEEHKFSKDDITYITCLILNHMFENMNTVLSKKAYLQFFAKLDQAQVSIIDYLILNWSDRQANLLNPRKSFGEYLKFSIVHSLYYKYKFSKEPFTVKDLAIKGQDLLNLGFKQGVSIGECLQKCFELVQDGVLTNDRATLLNYVRSEWIQ